MPRVETLESRSLMASLVDAGLVVIDAGIPNQTLDQAVLLGDLNSSPGILSRGSIGDGPAGNADVQWYSFTLAQAARVVSELRDGADDSSFHGLLSLYGSDPYNFGDPYYANGYRLVDQAAEDGPDGAATLDRVLSPGTYFLAVSGAGNAYFHPLLAGSGLPGSAGGFELRVSATATGPGPFDGPALIGSDPAPASVLDRSPLIIRLELSGPIDPFSAFPGDTVTLTYNPNGTFGDGNDQAITLAGTNVSTSGTELQLILQAPLVPGHYQVMLSGDSGAGKMVVTALDGTPLGTDADHPFGQDSWTTFQVDGYEGTTTPGVAADDTPDTAHHLGDVTGSGIIQVGGAIGDDPFYNPGNSADPYFPDPIYAPGNDVDLYHFRISGPGRYAFLAEVFAGRIGSPLDPGMSLYRLNPADHTLEFVAGNNNGSNPIQTPDLSGSPLFTDSVLTVGLEAGDYYIAVSAGSNAVSPLEFAPPGTFGLLDPTVSHSAQMGWSTGLYVLNLLVHEAPDPPRVLAANPQEGSTLDHAPTDLVVKFDVPVNLPFLAFQAYQASSDTTLSPVFVVGDDGTIYRPRFVSYDYAANEARFLMLDGLPNGHYELHLSGALGLTDLAGNPLEGNDPSGDYVVRFTVDGPARGQAGEPLTWSDQEPNDDAEHAQELGVLFPHELEAGVIVARDSGQATADTADVFRFQILQARAYTFLLSGDNIPAGVQIAVTDESGQSMGLVSHNGGKTLYGTLPAGTYLLSVSGWDEGQAADLAYRLRVTFATSFDNAPPLLTGPEPLLAVRLDSLAPPPTIPVDPTPVDPPPVTPPVITPVTPPATPPVTPAPTDSSPPTPAPVGVPSGSPYGPIGLPTGGGTGFHGTEGPIAVDPYLPTVPQGSVGVTLDVPGTTSEATALAAAPSIGLVALANGTVGGERGSDGSGMDPNEPTQYAAIARSMVTTGVIVATISPSWVQRHDQGQSLPETQKTTELAGDGQAQDEGVQSAAATARTGGDAVRLDEFLAWMGRFVPEFLSRRAGDQRVASAAADSPVVVPRTEVGEDPVAGPTPSRGGDVSTSPAAFELAAVGGDHRWLLVLSATSVAAIVYARRRAASRHDVAVETRQERARRRTARTSSLKAAFKAIPRPTFARARGGSQPSSPAPRSNAAMRE